MTQAQIDAAIEAFAQGAAEAQRIGFDAVELHGAHGYLIDQFFWDDTNRRTDQYGGDLVDRTRFAVQTIRECRRRVGPGFPLLFRFSQWKPQDYSARLATSPAELGRFLKPLAGAGLDAFHCSTRRFWEPEFPENDLNLAGWTKRLTGKPTITVGSVALDTDFTEPFRLATGGAGGEAVGDVRHLDRLVEMLARGDFDLVAIGRALLADPAWPVKVREGRIGEIRRFSQRTLTTLV
jgi:2,4-dienoyl-CoA reductase-like NADH-dependent reductase (Old Yellow Enzyme family)